MTVLSLFDGMSCGQLALQKLGIKVKQYYAAEIDKHAIQVTQHNFPNTIQLGDVTKVYAKDLPKIDLLIGGSPCQGFSFAGKQLAFDDPRSKLFFEFVRLKNECNPTYFMLENVKMKKEFEIIISKYMGVAPIEINSALLSAQNRVRLYWTNIAAEPYGLFGDMQCMIPQPKDKGILLRDILESDVPDKYYLSEKMLQYITQEASKKINRTRLTYPEQAKCGAILANEYKQGTDSNFIVSSRGRESSVLTPKRTEYGKQIRKDYEAGKIKEQRKNIQQLEPRNDGKTNTLTSVQKDNLLQIGDKVRRLTELECERLQTVPDNYTNHVSSTQRYKMLGNGWTVDVIAYIFGFMKSELAKSAEW
ncbi:MAG: DNA (cytosine-5-)-methyltransferase [Bacteroidetes bacterium]|nr:DNA (cytosine-5-)-methyltransferase [Bacteroidota bacterium]